MTGLRVRAPQVGEGDKIVPLWRNLWDLHEAWGSYPGTQDAAIYRALARRIDDESALRRGFPLLRRSGENGGHIHLIAERDGEIVGQVEGWVEANGVDPRTPITCEIRSLIVAETVRGGGVGHALLEELAAVAGTVAPRIFAVAEVLAENPFRPFYRREGYAPVGWTLRYAPVSAEMPETARRTIQTKLHVRRARASDGFSAALLETVLAMRRRSVRDLRFDPPRTPDAAQIDALSTYLAARERLSEAAPPLDWIVEDAHGVRGQATFALLPLEAPFLTGQRAVLGRIAFDPAGDPALLLPPLLARAAERAHAFGAKWLELCDFSAPGTPLYEAARALGATPWSSVMGKRVC